MGGREIPLYDEHDDYINNPLGVDYDAVSPEGGSAAPLGLVPEVDDVLWSVRTPGAIYLVVRSRANDGYFDVLRVSGHDIDHLGEVHGHKATLVLIRKDLSDR